jgi:hypothetical protein
MSNLVKHAETELKAAGYDGTGMYEGLIEEAVLELIKTFADQGHSGMSASIVIGLFKQLASFEPLGPLTGEDSEWVDVAEQNGTLYQNKRCSHVFKDDEGAYDIDGKVFREPDGCCYTNIDSRVKVEFPYTPTTEYVDVPFENEGDE